MAFAFHYRATPVRMRAALFPGAWNPPTTAHLTIARAALRHVDEVIWVLPREMPHKTFHGAPFDARVEMLRKVAEAEPGFSVATCSAGLYIDIAHEACGVLPSGTEIHLLCGRDAAVRIATWEYARKDVFEEMIASFPLLVAAREGHFHVAERHEGRIVPIAMESSFSKVSSSDVRARIAVGGDWRPMVPNAIHDDVLSLYS